MKVKYNISMNKDDAILTSAVATTPILHSILNDLSNNPKTNPRLKELIQKPVSINDPTVDRLPPLIKQAKQLGNSITQTGLNTIKDFVTGDQQGLNNVSDIVIKHNSGVPLSEQETQLLDEFTKNNMLNSAMALSASPREYVRDSAGKFSNGTPISNKDWFKQSMMDDYKSKGYITSPIDELVSHEGAPDLARVKYYEDMIKAGEMPEPLKIINEGSKYGIEDGKHRFKAFRNLGFSDVPVELMSASKK